MMRKLLKYDIKSGLRIFGMIWLGIAVLTALVCLIFSIGNENTLLIGSLTLLPLVFGILGAVLFCDIFVAIRFYKGLLGREGYLMFTLPTSPWKLLTSQLITSILFVGGTTILSLSSLFLIMDAMFSSMGMSADFIISVTGIEFSFDGNTVITVLGQVVSIATGILTIYLACCLAHLCRSKRVLLSFVFYFAIDIALSIVSTILQVIFVRGDLDAMASMASNALYTIPFNLAVSLISFFLCEWILRKKLNLE